MVLKDHGDESEVVEGDHDDELEVVVEDHDDGLEAVERDHDDEVEVVYVDDEEEEVEDSYECLFSPIFSVQTDVQKSRR